MMESAIYDYPCLIKENHLDTFGHVNNATYLVLLEEARWDLITQNGYGVREIQATGIGPTILEIRIQFLRELRLRDQCIIQTQLLSYEGKVAELHQQMNRGDEVCCTAVFKIALFDLRQRKLILPTPEWLKAIGAVGS